MQDMNTSFMIETPDGILPVLRERGIFTVEPVTEDIFAAYGPDKDVALSAADMLKLSAEIRDMAKKSIEWFYVSANDPDDSGFFPSMEWAKEHLYSFSSYKRISMAIGTPVKDYGGSLMFPKNMTDSLTAKAVEFYAENRKLYPLRDQIQIHFGCLEKIEFGDIHDFVESYLK